MAKVRLDFRQSDVHPGRDTFFLANARRTSPGRTAGRRRRRRRRAAARPRSVSSSGRGRATGAIDAADEWYGRATPTQGGARHARRPNRRVPSARFGARRPLCRRRRRRRSSAAAASAASATATASVRTRHRRQSVGRRTRPRSFVSVFAPSAVRVLCPNLPEEKSSTSGGTEGSRPPETATVSSA